MSKISIKNTKKEEIQLNDDEENEKEEEIQKNNDNNIENIKEENNGINSEMLRLKSKKRNTRPFEREGTDVNLFSEEITLKNKENKNNQIIEKNSNSERNENEQQSLKIKINKKSIDKISNAPSVQTNMEEKQMKYTDLVREHEDSCDKCPLRCLVFIPIFIGYCFLSLFDFLTYLIVPLVFCLFYTIVFICNYCRNIVSNYQVEEEIGFSGAFTSENEIKIHVVEEGGVLHLNEILCFSYMSACVKRYFCFIFVMINHIIVPVLQAWKKAKDCFIKSEIEVLYDERMAVIEEAKKYKGFDQAEDKIDINI